MRQERTTNSLRAEMVRRREVPQEEGKKRIAMGTELLLTGLFLLLVLGLLAALVYSMAIVLGHGRTSEAEAQDPQGQQRFLTASILNFIVQK